MAFPHFLVIGAQKAGTSWLAKNLSGHPGIWTPPLKELHYFDERIKEPSLGSSIDRLFLKDYTDEDWYPWYWRYQLRHLWKSRFRRNGNNFDLETILWACRFFMRSPTDRWYASLFEHGRGKITGEVTPAYSILEEGDIAHIYQLMPSAKIIFFMRNPIERPYSSAVMILELLQEMRQEVRATTDESFFMNFFRDPRVVSETRYLQCLEKWRCFYPDNQIFIGFLEDLHFYPVRLLNRLYRFLGVDPFYARKAIRRKIHSRSQEKMPTRLAAHLARIYHEDLQRLSARFGGYASFWLYCAERLTHNTPDEDTITYPLWNSWLWEEWMTESRSFTPLYRQHGGVQSKPLA